MRNFLSLTFFTVVLLFGFAACVSTNSPREKLKNGTFHFYTPENIHFLIVKTDTLDTEINTRTGDSSFWHVQWIDDYTYNTTFIRKTNPDTGLRQHFNLNTKAQIHITKITADYYLFESVLDYLGKTYKYKDTIWFQEKK